jgi:hypothetical protein
MLPAFGTIAQLPRAEDRNVMDECLFVLRWPPASHAPGHRDCFIPGESHEIVEAP